MIKSAIKQTKEIQKLIEIRLNFWKEMEKSIIKHQERIKKYLKQSKGN